MKIGKTLYITQRKDWRDWLSKNYDKESEIWLIFPKKTSGQKRLSYNDSVEEALCFGWIDSIVKGIDEEKYVQRFSPRKSTSVLSQMNTERINKLIAGKKMTPAGLKAIAHVFDPKKQREFKIAPDILKALKADAQTWKNFENFPESYKRIRISYIENYRDRDPEMFKKALKHFIERTSKNKKYGFVKELS